MVNKTEQGWFYIVAGTCKLSMACIEACASTLVLYKYWETECCMWTLARSDNMLHMGALR